MIFESEKKKKKKTMVGVLEENSKCPCQLDSHGWLVLMVNGFEWLNLYALTMIQKRMEKKKKSGGGLGHLSYV